MPGQIRGGLDEVGWGALAGPVICAVAVMDDTSLALLPHGVTDSKQTTSAQRSQLYQPLCSLALDVGIGYAWPWEVDQYTPGSALQLSYRRALEALRIRPDVLVVDGKNRVTGWGGVQIVEPKADVNHPQVSAASIIAKHFRDTIMADYARARRAKGLPDYGWERNSGYPTADHMAEILKHGVVVDPNDRTSDHSGYLHRVCYCKKLLAKRGRAG